MNEDHEVENEEAAHKREARVLINFQLTSNATSRVAKKNQSSAIGKARRI